MPFQGRHVETGSLIGSWPLVSAVVSGQPVLLPRTMQSKATILGIRREPSAGYDVDARSFTLKVDGTSYPVNFSYGAFLPLSVVISQINAAVGFTVAFNDNNFLKLQSPTDGTGSLEIITDPSSSPTNVFLNLGLFAGTVVNAGDLVQAQTPDPDRQVSTPGQMTMAEGESFEARVFNRAIAQLSINNDRNEGQLSKKRLAMRSEVTVGSYSPPVGCHGVQLSGGELVYVGKATARVIDDLKKLFAVLDRYDREFTKDVYVPVVTGFTGTFGTSTDGTGRQEVVSSAFNAISESVAEISYYVLSTAFTGGATVFNGKPLKILEVRPGLGASSSAIIENIDPSTGQRVAITQAGVAFDVSSRLRAEIVVDGVYADATAAAAGTPRLENVRVNKRTTIAPTRVELGNRIVFVGQNFTTAPAVQVGDIVNWHSSTINTPFNNNGDYRVDKIIDKETLQVVASDWGPALLNPNTTGGSVGTVHIQTDGAFVKDPFLRFSSNATLYAQPGSGDEIHLALFSGKTFRQASDDSPALFQGDVRFTQEADDSVARAVTRMWGPSVTSVDQILYQDERINIESLNSRLNWEHYNYDDAEKTGSSAVDTRSWGRHKDVRPDTINMWYWTPSQNTPRVTLRGTATRGHGGDVNDSSDALLQVRNSSDQVLLQLDGDGRFHNKSLSSQGDVRTFMDLRFESPDDEPRNLGGYNITGNRTIWKGSHHWYSTSATSTSMGVIGQHLITDLELTNATGGTKFDRIIGSKVEIGGTTNNAQWATDLKFLELTGSLNKSATDYADNQDAVDNFYGVHVGYTLSGNFKIFGNHYGVKIENITRAGTAVGGSGINYAIYSGGGEVRHGDRLTIDPSQTIANNYGIYVGPVPALTVGGAFGVYTEFPTATAQATLYGYRVGAGTNSSGAAMRGLVIGALSSSGSNGSAHGIQIDALSASGSFATCVAIGTSSITSGTNGVGYGLSLGAISGTGDTHYGVTITSVANAAVTNAGVNVGTVSGAATNNYGLKLGTVSGGSSNYAIFTGVGFVQFGDSLTIANPSNRLYGISLQGWSNTSHIYAFDVGIFSSSAGRAYGMRFQTITGVDAYGIGIGTITGTTAAIGILLDGVTSSTSTAMGVSIGAMTGASGSNAYEIDLSAPVASGGSAIGIRLAMPITGATTYGLQALGASSSVADMYSLSTGNISTSKTSGQAYGLNLGTTTVSGTNSLAYGIKIGNVVASTATNGNGFGLFVGNVTCSSSTAGRASGIEVGDITHLGLASGIRIGIVAANNAGGDAVGINMDAPSATGGDTAIGIQLGMPITGASVYGLRILGGTSSTSSVMYGLAIGDLSNSNSVCEAIHTGDLITAATNGAHMNLGTTDSNVSTSSLYGVKIGAVTAAGTSSSATTLWVGPPAGTLSSYGIQTYDISYASSGEKVSILTGLVSGTSTANYGIKVSNVSGATTNYAIYTGTGTLRFGSAASDECYVMGATDTGTSTTTALYINTTNGQLGLNSSSIKVKENVEDMGDTSWLYDLRPVRFMFKTTGERSYGLIAEELAQTAPDLVFYRPTKTLVPEDYKPEVWDRVALDEEGNKFKQEMGGIHYDRLIPVLINELKKLKARVDQLA